MGRGMVLGGEWLRRAAAVTVLVAMESIAWSAPVGRDLLACGEIAGPTERLACFDRYLAIARAQGVESAPPLPQTRAKSARPASVREVVSTVGRVLPSGAGRWTIVLADDSVWQSYDATAREPRVGQPVHIRRGTLGSYLADIGDAPGVVLKRLR